MSELDYPELLLWIRHCHRNGETYLEWLHTFSRLGLMPPVVKRPNPGAVHVRSSAWNATITSWMPSSI